jgi:hypothetical protein
VADRVAEATKARGEIQAAPDDTRRSVLEQKHKQVENSIELVRVLGDAVISAFFAEDKAKAREKRRATIESWVTGIGEAKWDELRDAAANLRTGKHPLRPFHWAIEFPEVFARDNPGFDAIVGNPPFLGVTALGQLAGPGYTDWLRQAFGQAGGKCDVIAFFFRRSFQKLRHGGTFGLVATNTIGQGDTRTSGLLQIIRDGGSIYRAQRRLRWPGDAAVVVSLVHVTRAQDGLKPCLDGVIVSRISSYLSARIGDVEPKPLTQLYPYIKGIVPYGEKFFVEIDEQITSGSPLTPFLRRTIGGKELNDTINFADLRYVIDLNRFSDEDELKQAGVFDAAYARLWPQRRDLGNVSGAANLKRYWWKHYFSPSTATSRSERIGIARLSSSFAWRHMASDIMPNEQVVSVFAEPRSIFAVLQGRVHELWARFFSSSLKDDLRYVPTDCFATFPFPANFETSPALEAAGQVYHDHRAALMVVRNEGMTKTYNRFHDADERSEDIVRLRELHAEMDRAVLRAYGWDDLADRADPIFLDKTNEDDHTYQGRLFWSADFRDDVLARLLALNAERHAEELRLGTALGAKGEAIDEGEGEGDGDEEDDNDDGRRLRLG